MNGDQAKRDSRLRDDVLPAVYLMVGIATPLYLVMRSVLRFRLYELASFYLAVLAIAAWLAVMLIAYLGLRARRGLATARTVLGIVMILGIFYALEVGYRFGYSTFLVLVYFVLGGLWGLAVTVRHMVKALRGARRP